MTKKSDLGRDLAAFKKWLFDRGAEVLEPTNRYELVRFRSSKVGVSIVYRRENGVLTFTGEAGVAYGRFREGKAWAPALPRQKRANLRVPPRVAALRARDGDGCFYCGDSIDFSRPVSYRIEHVCALSQGGPNHLSNLVLACLGCEQAAGNQSVAEKVRLRDRKRRERFEDSLAAAVEELSGVDLAAEVGARS
jgi:5-methylcytosine-specific restriction endonuclease McrA